MAAKDNQLDVIFNAHTLDHLKLLALSPHLSAAHGTHRIRIVHVIQLTARALYQTHLHSSPNNCKSAAIGNGIQVIFCVETSTT